MNLIEQARAFATQAHAGQVRKYTGEPYITHPEAVAKIVQTVTADHGMIAAAFLHDVIEDTPVTLAQIRDEFGIYVAALVDGVTNDGSDYADKLHEYGGLAQTLKLADIIDNTATIVERDPKFAVDYLTEKAALLRVLTNGNPFLYCQASAQVYNGLRALGL